MLAHLIKKYQSKDVAEVVYRLSYAGKFIIVKGKTLAGSLIIINNTYMQYQKDTKRFAGHLYRHLYDHVNKKKKGRFRIKVLAKRTRKTDQYKLIKREQCELDQHSSNPKCLNNSFESYIPLFNEETGNYGWLEWSAVMHFKRYLTSQERKDYRQRYKT